MKTTQKKDKNENFGKHQKRSRMIGKNRKTSESAFKTAPHFCILNHSISNQKNINMKTEKKCQHCGSSFEPTRSDAKFCNTGCRWNAWKNRNKSESKIAVHPAAIRLLTNATWEFAHSILWGGYSFSKSEVALSKLFIQEYYEEIPAEEFAESAHKHFTAYCERVLLAKEYVSRFAHRYIPHPCIWLNKENSKGFAGTKSWYLRNLERRKSAQLRESCGDNVNSILNHFHFCA